MYRKFMISAIFLFLMGCTHVIKNTADNDSDIEQLILERPEDISERFVSQLPFLIEESEVRWIESYVKSLPDSSSKFFLLYQCAVVANRPGQAQYYRSKFSHTDLPETWLDQSQKIDLAYARLLNKPLTYIRLAKSAGYNNARITSDLSFFKHGALISSQSGDSSGIVNAALWAQEPWQKEGLVFPNGHTIRPSEKHIGLILPLTGEYADTSQAIKAGFSSAFYQFNKVGSLSFFDSSIQSIQDILSEGDKQGITHWVGPMDWQHISKINELKSKSQSLLALSENAPAGVAKLSLSTHVEARMMAEHLFASGHRRILMVEGSTQWHQQLAEAFTRKWEALGGEIIHKESLGVKVEKSLASALKYTTVKKRNLYDVIKPSVRDDVSAIFLALNHDEATKIGPMMKFLYAGHFPLFATSAVIAPNTSYADITDLDGMVFYDWPWLNYKTVEQGLPLMQLREELEKNHDNFREYIRFYALGIDAFLLSYYDGIERSPIALHAASGALNITHGEVERTLRRAKVGPKGIDYI